MSNKDNSTSINKKVFDSKKYFIYAFKRHILNENKILYKKFLPSIREVLLDYIDIYDDVNQITPAMDHYFSTVSHAGEAENLPAQSASLTKLGNIYTDMYDKEAFNYYDVANDIAQETDNYNIKGFVASNTGNAYMKFEEPEKALKSYSNAVKNYTDADSPLKTAQNYLAAADIMVEFNNLNKAYTLLNKAQRYARQTENINLMNEINTKIKQLENLDVK